MSAARVELEEELHKIFDKRTFNENEIDKNMIDKLVKEGENYSNEEYQAVRTIALKRKSLSDADIYAVIGRQYLKASFIRKRLEKENIL